MAKPQLKKLQEPQPPYRPDLVYALHSASFANPAVFQRVRHLVRGDDFYPSDRAIWEAEEAIVDGGDIPDEFSVIEWLKRRGRLGDVNGGALAIQQLSTAVSPDYDYMCEQWARAILDDSKRRTQIALSQALALVAYYPDVAVYRADMERQQRRLDDIQRRMRGEGDAAPVFKPLGVSMADVAIETFDWLWHGRIAFGKIATFDGDGGIGKSLATIDLIARAVMGRSMPDGSPGLAEPTGAILICGEDGLSDTVAPRLLAAGVGSEAVQRVRTINLVPETLASGEVSQRLISLLDDLPKLEATIEALGARILVIDPITAYLGDGIDIYKDSQVRRVLTPLALMAERQRLAVVMTRHLNRSAGASAQHRGLGSVAFLNIARLGLLFAPNPDAEGEVLISRYKGNIGAPPPTLAYRIMQVGESESMPYLRWLGERETSAETALASQIGASGDCETRSASEEAVEWLRSYLTEGPRPAKEIQDAAKADKITERPLRKAKERLGIVAYREGGIAGGGRWMWRYDDSSPESDHLRQNDHTAQATNKEFNGAAAKMTAHTGTGHLSAEMLSKMTTAVDTGHLSADADFNGTDVVSEVAVSPKMTAPREKVALGHDDHVCEHPSQAVRTLQSGQTVCGHCGQEVMMGSEGKGRECEPMGEPA